MSTEQEYMDAALKEGVDVPELKKTEEEESPEENSEPEEKPQEEETEEEEEKPEPLQDQKKKPSIYDDLKEKKRIIKEKDAALQNVLSEIADLKGQIAALTPSSTPKEKQEVMDSIEAYAEDHGIDATEVIRLKKLLLSDVSSPIDENLKKDIEDLKIFRAQNQEVVEKNKFETSFTEAEKDIKELFPTAKLDELTSIKNKIFELSKTAEFKGKDLDYVAFKNKTTLSALISPHKRGLESRGRNHSDPIEDTDFDPNADFSKMSPAAQEKWMQQYNKLGKSSELITDSEGRKIIL